MKILLLITALFATLLLPTAADANTRAILTTPTSETKTIIINDAPWTCVETECHAPSTGSSRIETQCIRVAKALGRVSAFYVNGIAFSAEMLNACNAKAKRP
jgi:NRPS condensation-like uncharacterized protein